jgi:hypothetical protein
VSRRGSAAPHGVPYTRLRHARHLTAKYDTTVGHRACLLSGKNNTRIKLCVSWLRLRDIAPGEVDAEIVLIMLNLIVLIMLNVLIM